MVMTAYHSDSSSYRRHICHRSNSFYIVDTR
jgi:hypothetical protein